MTANLPTNTNPGTCPECGTPLRTRNWRQHLKRHGWHYDHAIDGDSLFPPTHFKKINGVDGYVGPNIPIGEEDE